MKKKFSYVAVESKRNQNRSNGILEFIDYCRYEEFTIHVDSFIRLFYRLKESR